MANPNKTVARARKRMGGFPHKEPRMPDPFIDWLAGKARQGVAIASYDEAREIYAREQAENESRKPTNGT